MGLKLINKEWRISQIFCGILIVSIFALFYFRMQTGSTVGLFLTPDQQAQLAFKNSEYSRAAELFRDPFWQGISQFRNGEYKTAAQTFNRVNTAEGHYNRGNSLVMIGKYDEAIKAYDRSLELRPNWKHALQNREIASIRAERIKLEGGDMTGGKLGADKIVIEPGKKNQQSSETEVTAGGSQLSDQELQALWLRRVQTKPADFLRSKFAFQLSETENQATPTEP